MGTQNDLKYISIHALREESDQVIQKIIVGLTLISIHALREESDAPPVDVNILVGYYFNPRSP